MYNYIEVVDKIKNKHKKQILILSYMSAGTEPVNKILKNIAAYQNITYLPSYKEEIIANSSEYFIEDGWHPNKKGHRLIAEKIYNTLMT